MANAKVASKGGQGGRLGHSNMEHSTYTAEVKQAARNRRRAEARSALLRELQDDATEIAADAVCPVDATPANPCVNLTVRAVTRDVRRREN